MDPCLASDPQLKAVITDRTWLFLQQPERTPAELDLLLDDAAASLSQRSLNRRRKVIHREPPVRMCDLAPAPSQIAAIQSTGCQVIRVVRYINAVSVSGSVAAVQKASELPFICHHRPVYAFKQKYDDSESADTGRTPSVFTDDADDYGFSYLQSALVNLPGAHDRGYRGRGVLIGVQDTGFDNLNHRGFSHIQVVAAWDFVNNDAVVADQQDMGSGAHGTKTLSVIAARDSGEFIGVAPEALFALTKTENTAWERPIEEDAWVAGLWFHDSVGTDILSSSLSYSDWYDYEDIDGETAITSIAADSAVAAGMVIINSAGNAGREVYPFNKVGVPADARNVIAVGGVNSDSSYWSASSQGPTSDGRIKPDLAALSIGVYVANNFLDTGYIPRSGTSYACPMIAGIAALILEANPELTPFQVMEILRESSSRADNPDTLFGFGIPDALAAVIRAESMFIGTEINIPHSSIFYAYPNPFNGSIRIEFLSAVSPGVVELVDIRGRILNTHIPQPLKDYIGFTLNMDNFANGVYYLRSSNAGNFQVEKIVLLR